MAIIEKKKVSKPEIDLSGPAGNTYALLGAAERYAKLLGKDAKAINERMISGDYENLIKVFDEEFGDYVDLIY